MADINNRSKRISAALLSLLLCSCTVKTGSSTNDSSSAVSAAVSETSSSQTSATTETKEPEVVLPEIKGFKGSSDKTAFKLKWSAAEGADGYELTLRPAEGGNEESYDLTPDKNSYTLTDRKNGECAFFTLKAYKSIGDSRRYIAQSREIRLTTMRESVLLTVQSVCQYSQPALPTGCECAALTTLLKHCGFGVTKNEIASKYLKKIPFVSKKVKGKKGETVLYGADPNEAFPGDPQDENSYGCYAKPLVDAANKYLETQETTLRAKDLTGKKLSALYKYVNNGTPIVVWATNGLKASKKTDSWVTTEGKEITWLYNEHCLVLVGYDEKKKIVYCADPSKRETQPQKYDAKLFEKRFKEQGSHAVIIE